MSLNDSQEKFANEALTAHNSYRKMHGADPLTLNPDLNLLAQSHAIQLAKAGSLIHSSNSYRALKLGENLAYMYDSRPRYYSGAEPSMNWYNEVKEHDYDGDFQRKSGHFTQVVWKSSKEVGFGVARADDGSYYTVANYYPPGNYRDSVKENVQKS